MSRAAMTGSNVRKPKGHEMQLAESATSLRGDRRRANLPFGAALAALVLVAACAHGGRPVPARPPEAPVPPPSEQGSTRSEPPPAEEPRPEEPLLGEGMASFYGEAFRGRLTANGERFNPDALTAAHRTLPFGTCLRVVDQDTGRSIRVRVNDRGPYAKGRILDLSERAARLLDLVDRGVTRVRLFLCGGRGRDLVK